MLRSTQENENVIKLAKISEAPWGSFINSDKPIKILKFSSFHT